ncbi:hypothetical protein THAOC_31531, partial [Thalassiosira oceanica]
REEDCEGDEAVRLREAGGQEESERHPAAAGARRLQRRREEEAEEEKTAGRRRQGEIEREGAAKAHRESVFRGHVDGQPPSPNAGRALRGAQEGRRRPLLPPRRQRRRRRRGQEELPAHPRRRAGNGQVDHGPCPRRRAEPRRYDLERHPGRVPSDRRLLVGAPVRRTAQELRGVSRGERPGPEPAGGPRGRLRRKRTLDGRRRQEGLGHPRRGAAQPPQRRGPGGLPIGHGATRPVDADADCAGGKRRGRGKARSGRPRAPRAGVAVELGARDGRDRSAPDQGEDEELPDQDCQKGRNRGRRAEGVLRGGAPGRRGGHEARCPQHAVPIRRREEKGRGKRKKGRERGGGGQQGDEDGDGASSSGKDARLSMFHALGKLLYAKRGPREEDDAGRSRFGSDPAISEAVRRAWDDGRPPLLFDPDRVLSTIEMGPDAGTSFVSYHCPDFHTDPTDLDGTIGTLSDAAVFLDRSMRAGGSGSDGPYPTDYAVALGGRAVAVFNRNPAPPRFRKLTAPESYGVMRKERENARRLVGIRGRLLASSSGDGGGAPRPSVGGLAEFVTDVLPHARIVRPGDADRALSGLHSYAREVGGGGKGAEDDDGGMGLLASENVLMEDDLVDGDW